MWRSYWRANLEARGLSIRLCPGGLSPKPSDWLAEPLLVVVSIVSCVVIGSLMYASHASLKLFAPSDALIRKRLSIMRRARVGSVDSITRASPYARALLLVSYARINVFWASLWWRVLILVLPKWSESEKEPPIR